MTAPTMQAAPQAGPAAPGQMPAGAAKMATLYYDASGRLHSANRDVPVTGSGRLAGTDYTCRRYSCRKGKAGGWYPVGLKEAPTCPLCQHRMVEVPIKRASVVPWRQVWTASKLKLVPVAAVGAELTAGAAVGGAQVPAYVLAGLTPTAGWVANRVARRRLLKQAADRGRIDLDDSASDKRVRAAIDRQARLAGYTATAATGWLALADATGLDPHTPGGIAALLSLLAVSAVPAATWWRKTRSEPPAEIVAEEIPDETPAEPTGDPDETYVRRVWAYIVAAKKGQVGVIKNDGTEVVAERNGKLVETWLEDWHRVVGGWAATAVSPPGLYTAETFLGAQGAVASAFRMKKSMVTVVPDADDETRALFLAQRTSPIVDTVRWPGPSSINTKTGRAPLIRYIDGSWADFELWRPGWGCPHVGMFGTTGSGKSELINALFTVDRWAHGVDEQGNKFGLVADFLVDPQQGQSFAEFLDELAAPVAASLDEAHLLVRALTAEFMRRNRYLARHAKWWDERRKKWRTGRKWWNPLIDGPILALTIDEAHAYLADRPFAAMVTAGGRMWRKCGGQLRIATHTPLLNDLGGSMALRDMLTGGFTAVFRTANALTGTTAFNGRLPVDPRTIPEIPGMCYALSGLNPRAMLGRAVYEPDWYDWIRDESDRPIGYPAVLPDETLRTFGRGYADWLKSVTEGAEWEPDAEQVAEREEEAAKLRAFDAVLLALGEATGPLDMDGLDEALQRAGTPFKTRTIRDALATMRKAEPPLVVTSANRHQLTSAGTAEAVARAEALGVAR